MDAVQYTQFMILKMLLNAQEEKKIVHIYAFAARNLGADAKCIADTTMQCKNVHYSVHSA